jgi:hypothetical protein
MTPTLYLYMSYNTLNIIMDFSAFSHGQIHSKLWLCEEIEKFITKPVNVAILGCWYNILGFMMVTRNKNLYSYIHGVDFNQDAISVANKICDAWMINDDQKIKNQCYHVSNIEFYNYDIIINTSVEDIISMQWYENIWSNKIVCLQSNNLTPDKVSKYSGWNIVNPNPDIETFKNKYPMSEILFEGEKEFDYGDLKYSRYMIIGKK